MPSFVKLILFITFSLNIAWAQDALKAEAFKLWEKRDEKESLSQAIIKFEQIHKARPQETEVVTYLLRSYFIMGDFHSQDKDQKLKNFEKAFSLGDTVLARNSEFAERIKNGDDIQEAVKNLKEADVPVMFWTAANIGKFAKTTGIFASMKYKGKILALVSRVEELKPDYFFGAVPRYWGSYFAVIPRIAGRDLKKSKKYFEKSILMAPAYLGTKVIQAETYFVEDDDKDGFKKVLNSVLQESSFDHHPEVGPENRMEKIKAKKLLEKLDDLF